MVKLNDPPGEHNDLGKTFCSDLAMGAEARSGWNRLADAPTVMGVGGAIGGGGEMGRTWR